MGELGVVSLDYASAEWVHNSRYYSENPGFWVHNSAYRPITCWSGLHGTD